MQPGTQFLSGKGTLTDDNNNGIWSTGILENDTLTIAPVNFWTESPTASTLIISASDLAGNTIDTLTLNYTVDSNTDRTPPVTTIVSPTKAEHNASFDVSFTCDDAQGSGCVKIWYTLDKKVPGSSGFIDLKNNNNPTLNLTNSVTLKFLAEDLAGNKEKTQSIDYIVENQNPVTNINLLESDGPFNAPIIVTLSCTDLPKAGNSGCRTITYTLGNNSPQIFTPNAAIPDIGININATTTLIYHSEDKAGNIETINSQLYVIDTVAPIFTMNPLSGSLVYELSQIIITFNDAMNTNPGSLAVGGDLGIESDGGTWSSSKTGINDILTIKPTTGWAIGTGKTMSIKAEDIAGNPVSTGLLTYTVLNSTLNDTGVTLCANTDSNGLVCNDLGDGTGIGSVGGTTLFPSQDAEIGRDNLAVKGQLLKLGSGRAGFDFTKLDAKGLPLSNQTEPYGSNPWSCVRDNVTGLIWEVKTPSGSGDLRETDATYTWYNSDSETNGGSPGTPNGGACLNIGKCDTEKYVDDIKTSQLCGLSNWRLPTKSEITSIVDFSIEIWNIGVSGPAIDLDYFPHTFSSSGKNYWYWTFNYAISSIQAMALESRGGSLSGRDFSNPIQVRLVSGGQGCKADNPITVPNKRFINHNDGTVTDKRTNLMWKRCPEGYDLSDNNTALEIWDDSCKQSVSAISAFTWQLALQHAQTMNNNGGYAAKTNWRVPNIKELVSLPYWGDGCYSQRIVGNSQMNIFPSPKPFPQPYPSYRSSTTGAYGPGDSSQSSWTLRRDDTGTDYKSANQQLRLVREAK